MNKTSSLFLEHKSDRLKPAPYINVLVSGLVLIILAFFTIAAGYHIKLQPYPNNWDDAWYAIHTFRWIEFIKQSPDIFRGIFWGFVYVLPSHMPPLVFITSLISGVFGKSLIMMRYAHLFWFFILISSVYGIGNKLGGRKAGLISLILVSSTTLVFYWSKTIMGEPALFATFALFLLLLISWGESPNYLQSFIMGGVFGLGLLTKQHYIILVGGPLILWAFWYVVSKRNMLLRQKFLQAVLFILAAGLIAGFWYFLNFQEFINFINQTESFLPHSLGPVVSLQSIYLYMRNFVSQIGVASAILFLTGNIFAAYRIGLSFKRKQLLEWDSLILLFMAIPGAVLIIIVIMQRNINTRFITPALIPWGILSGLALSRFQKFSKIAWIASLVLFIIHLLFWWDQSFNPISFQFFPFFPKKSFMRPIDITPLPESVDKLDSSIPPGSKPFVYIVGGTSRFNPPLVLALMEERNFQSQAKPLYTWEDPDNLEFIISRLSTGDWIILYEPIADRADLFTYFSFDTLLIRNDNDILAWVKGHSESFNLVSMLESIDDNNRIWIYQKIS